MTAQSHSDAGVSVASLMLGIPAGLFPEQRMVHGLSLDSRRVKPGDLFLGLPGTRDNGANYIGAAIAAGASAVLVDAPQSGCEERNGVPVISVPGLKQLAGIVASRFFGCPSSELMVIGVTGTNGKTSVAHFIGSILDRVQPGSTGVVGTLGSGLFGNLVAGRLTTPDAVQLQETLAGFHSGGARAVVMEVSSHALDQGRVAGVEFDYAVFTNLTRDHLDYHADLAAYGHAKRNLFTMPGLRAAVINADDEFGRELMAEIATRVPVVVYSLAAASPAAVGGTGFVTGRVLAAEVGRLCLAVNSSWGEGEVECAVTGRFNATNLLAAIGTACTAGIPLSECLQACASIVPVAGRMECFSRDDSPKVIVDYAHSPDALEKALQTLREMTSGQLSCVFGCGGDRDAGKRPQMGAIAARLADRVFITSDNPRGESPEAIIGEIVSGISDRERVVVIPDRAEAVSEAIGSASCTDVVLVAGKGHETYQEIRGRRYPFSDRQLVRTLLEAAR